MVIAIMGILAGMAGLSVSAIFSTRERKCANEIDSLLSECRVLTLSGVDHPVLRFELEGNRYVGVIEASGTERTRKDLGSDKIELSFVADTNRYSVAVEPLYLAFLQETGAMYDLDKVSGNGVSGSCTEIRSGKYRIELTPATGYHKLGF